MSDIDQAQAPAEPPSDTEQLREEISETREGLGDTVEALAQKTDVKAQVADKREEAKERVRSKVAAVREKAAGTPAAQQAIEQPWIPAGAAAGLLLLMVWRSRRA
jgi:ribosome-binding protein aMBF1 (putative translation factor)